MNMQLNRFLVTALLLLPYVHAELPPWAYEEMKRNAKEVLVIQATGVQSLAGTEIEDHFLVDANVHYVNRTSTNLEINDTIQLETYVHSQAYQDSGIVGPSDPIPVSRGDCLFSYLNPPNTTETMSFVYELAAGGKSFEKLGEEECASGLPLPSSAAPTFLSSNVKSLIMVVHWLCVYAGRS